MNTLLLIYLAIGFILWNLAILMDDDVKQYSLLKQIGFAIFTSTLWGAILIKMAIQKSFKK